MSDNKEQCRTEFEVWARSEGHSPILYGIGEDAEYDMPEHYLFAGWRAAWNRAAQPVVLSDEQINRIAGRNGIYRAMTLDDQACKSMIKRFVGEILAAKEQA